MCFLINKTDQQTIEWSCDDGFSHSSFSELLDCRGFEPFLFHTLTGPINPVKTLITARGHTQLSEEVFKRGLSPIFMLKHTSLV